MGGRSTGSGILHALTRSSREVSDRWNVIATDANPFAWGLYKVEQKTLLPHGYDQDYICKLEEVVRKFNVHAIIPGSEIEVDVLSRNRNAFGIPVIVNSSELIPLMPLLPLKIPVCMRKGKRPF